MAVSGRVVSVAAVVSLLVASAAWGMRGEANIDARTTGDNSELIKSIPIEKNAGNAKTALKLDPDEMPDLLPGDRLRVSSELLVTTDCLFDSPRCVGKPYKFNPTIDTFLVLDSGQDEIELKSDRRRCLQEEDERQHHCQIAFVGVSADQAANQLNCEINNCSLKVKVRAFAPEADGGERVVIGSNQPNGSIEQDKARLNAIRIRPPAVVPEPFASGPVRNDFAPVLEKVVLYSQKLNALKQGEVIEAAVDARATTAHLGYPALLGTQIILAEKANDKRPSGLVKRLASTSGEITEISGTNCTPKQSPCPITRTGLVEMRRDARAGGQVVPLYVNVIARSKAKRADADRGDKVKLKDFRGLRVWRYGE
jgi:hypothetical protein